MRSPSAFSQHCLQTPHSRVLETGVEQMKHEAGKKTLKKPSAIREIEEEGRSRRAGNNGLGLAIREDISGVSGLPALLS